MKRAIIFVLLLSMEHYSFSQNLVVNPGFENWGKVTKPTGWTTSESCLKDSVNILSGSYSCRQEGSSVSKNLEQIITISPEKQYRFSFFFKTGTTGNGCRVWCEWLDDKQVPINDPLSAVILHSDFMKSDSWQQFSIDITPPAGAEYFDLLIRSLPNSITYWENFLFTENVPTYNHEEKTSEIIIYPNPASNFLNISNINNVQHIDMQNLSGITFRSFNFSGEKSASIPLSGLTNGLYILRIKMSGKTIIRKFIKN
jgi:hypothetical protein